MGVPKIFLGEHKRTLSASIPPKNETNPSQRAFYSCLAMWPAWPLPMHGWGGGWSRVDRGLGHRGMEHRGLVCRGLEHRHIESGWLGWGSEMFRPPHSLADVGAERRERDLGQ